MVLGWRVVFWGHFASIPFTATVPALTAVRVPPCCLPCCHVLVSLQDMRVGLLSADQEKELAAMVQDLLHLERAARDLHISLGRPPTDLEWMEAAGCPAGQEPEADVQAAVQQFKARLHHGRSAKQVGH